MNDTMNTNTVTITRAMWEATKSRTKLAAFIASHNNAEVLGCDECLSGETRVIFDATKAVLENVRAHGFSVDAIRKDGRFCYAATRTPNVQIVG